MPIYNVYFYNTLSMSSYIHSLSHELAYTSQRYISFSWYQPTTHANMDYLHVNKIILSVYNLLWAILIFQNIGACRQILHGYYPIYKILILYSGYIMTNFIHIWYIWFLIMVE